jgi:acetoin utilization deacetylase AcuC-like enzyme
LATLIVSHPCFLAHQTPPGHPERPDRLRVVTEVLGQERFQFLLREEAPEAARDTVLLAHPPGHLEALEAAAPRDGLVKVDADTAMSPGTLEAALRAVGASCRAVDAVIVGAADNAFCAIRPPGHHAETVRAMGFCFFNNVAIAARHAQRRHGIGRVAIIDFDVHHGNGTQEILWDDASVMYCSTHEMPLYPGTGARGETGAHDTIVNAPLAAGDDGTVFRQAFDDLLLPRLDAFQPELVLVSAGFDAHRRDPLANLELDEADFAWVTRKLMALADKHAGGRLVSLLEGGYDLIGLARSVEAHVDALAAG